MEFVLIAIWLIIGLLLIASLLPLSKVAFGAIRGLEFPRQQVFVIALTLAIAIWILQPGVEGLIGAGTLIFVAMFQLVHIVKFTPVWSGQSVSASPSQRADIGAQVSFLAANIKMSNRSYERFLKLVRSRDPDILMVIETDQAWLEALKPALADRYAHWIEVPMDTGYGMCLLSKLKLSDGEVRDVVTVGVPSIRTVVTLRNGARFRLYVVHPEPPIASHDTIGRDSEIALVGLEAAADPLPAVVSGDLNDVAWSATTRRFQRLSGLLDPRVGRGFYNTFSATMPWMRWPLDHLFHDPMFRLVDMGRLGKIGSDHFPMWFALHFAGDPAEDASPGTPHAGEEFATKRMVVKERNRPRKPIGEDWEDNGDAR